MKWTLVTFLILVATASQAEEESIDRLQTEYAEWRNGVQFHSTYQLREGTADDFADVFDGEPFDEVSTTATGVFCKSKNLLRISIDYGAATELETIVDLSAGATLDSPVADSGDLSLRTGQALTVSNASEDEVTDGDRWLVYRPRWKNTNDRVVLSRLSRNPDRECTTGQLRISPLNPFPGFNPDPFGGEAILGEKASVDVVSTDELTIVTITSGATFDQEHYSQVNTFELRNNENGHVIQRIDRRITRGDGELFLKREARLSDFRECPGGAVARCVLFASQSSRAAAVHVTEWISGDLGDRPPVDEDFQITIPKSTVILGVAAPLPPGEVRTLDIRDLIDQ